MYKLRVQKSKNSEFLPSWIDRHIITQQAQEYYRNIVKAPAVYETDLLVEALLTMTQTMTMCSTFEHFMNGNGAI